MAASQLQTGAARELVLPATAASVPRMPQVSVLLPTCDRPALLPRAVHSVLAQTGVDLELVVVDSNRRTPAVTVTHASEAWMREPRLRVIAAPGARNAAGARNAGLAAATGEWISYLDDDDVYRAGKLRDQLALAGSSGSPLVLCGAEFFLRQRRRIVQCGAAEWCGDDLLLHARWNTPLLFHRRAAGDRFDESLSPGEDAEFGHRLLARAGRPCVPVVPSPLVEIHPQPGPRVNSNPAPVRSAAARILAQRPGFYSRAARRRYVLQTLLAVAKLRGRRGRTLQLSWALVRESRGADWRACANALAVSTRFMPGRWVS